MIASIAYCITIQHHNGDYRNKQITMANKMKVLTAGVKSSSNKKSKKKKSSNNNTKQLQQSHSTTTANTTATANNDNDIESAAAVDSSTTNTVDNRLNTLNNDNINGGHSIVGKFFL